MKRGVCVNLIRKQPEMKTRHRTVVSRAQRSQVRKRVEKRPDCGMTGDDMKLQAAVVAAAING